MKITINDHRIIRAIQEEFSTMFPYLKLLFYAKPNSMNGSASDKIVLNPLRTLGDCRTMHRSGSISITPQMTVAEVTQTFMDVYGLTIQIMRKSGNAWLTTTMTDMWTLEMQNNQGEQLSER